MTLLRPFAARVAKSELVRHGTLVFAALMAANVLQFALYTVLSRLLGVERYGVLNSLFSVTLLIATGPATVAGTVVARLAADLRAAGDVHKLRRLGDVVTLGTAIVGLIAFAATAILAPAAATYLHLATLDPVIITGIGLAFSVAIPVQRGVFQGTQNFTAFAVSNVIEAVAKVVISSLLAWKLGVDGALAGVALGFCFAWIYNAFELRRAGDTARPLAFDMRRIFLTSANVALAVLSVNVLLFYDVILVRHYFSGLSAGLYGAAALVARAMYTVIAFIPTIVLPKASVRRGDGRGTRSLLLVALGGASMIVAVAVGATAIAPRTIATILAGRAFADAGFYVLPYTIALGLLALANVATMYNIGVHRFTFVAPLVVVAACEIVAVSFLHRDIAQVLLILCVGHALAFVVTVIPYPQTLNTSLKALLKPS